MQIIIAIILLIFIAALAGCQNASSSVATNPIDPAPAVTNTQPAVPPATPDDRYDEPHIPKGSQMGSLATPTDAYKTAHELRKRRDIEGLKAIMSKDIKEFLTMMGEAENKTLDDMLREMVEKPQAERAEARNEKIKGDRATVEYLTETGAWKTMDFEKVNGKWLLTFPKAEKAEFRTGEN